MTVERLEAHGLPGTDSYDFHSRRFLLCRVPIWCYCFLMKRIASKPEQFVIDSRGNKVGVILDLETYRRLLEAEEDLADIAAYDAAAPSAHAAIKKGDFITLDQLKSRRRK